MELLGGYTQFDYDKVREGAKNPKRFGGETNPRKHAEFLEDEDSRDAATPVKKKRGEKSGGEEDWTPSARTNIKKQEDHEEEETKTEEVKSKRTRANLSFKNYF